MPEIFGSEINGLSCASCVKKVETALSAIPGIATAHANLATNAVEVRYDVPASPANIAEALSTAGYPAHLKQLRFDVEGMTCASCVRRLETALKDVPGVSDARINLADSSATLSVAGVDLDQLRSVARNAGYPIRLAEDDI